MREDYFEEIVEIKTCFMHINLDFNNKLSVTVKIKETNSASNGVLRYFLQGTIK